MRSKIAQNRGSLTADNVTSFVFVPAHQLQRDLAIHPNGLLLCSLYHTKGGSSALDHSFLIRMTFTAKNLVNQICEGTYLCLSNKVGYKIWKSTIFSNFQNELLVSFTSLFFHEAISTKWNVTQLWRKLTLITHKIVPYDPFPLISMDLMKAHHHFRSIPERGGCF